MTDPDPYSDRGVRFRQIALDQAIKTCGPTQPENVVRAARMFADYMRTETPPPKPAPPAAAPLPADLGDLLQGLHGYQLDILSGILRERYRQAAKGYGAEHDDAHDDGELAFQAALGIMPPGCQLDSSGTKFDDRDWIDRDLERPVQLVQGIALALAELERWSRVEIAAGRYYQLGRKDPPPVSDLVPLALEERTHGADSAVDDPQLVQVDLDDAERELARSLTDDDLDDMLHALGRPADPWAMTHRNYYAIDRGSLSAARFRKLAPFWEENRRHGSQTLRYFHLTPQGRAALAYRAEIAPKVEGAE